VKHPRRVLVAVTGLSPQVITETLYVLAVRRSPPWIPTEVQLITTSKGAERVRLALLSEDPGGFRRLLTDYQLPEIRFDERCIHVLRDAHGRLLDDIRTPEDNELAADFITDFVRRLTQDASSEIHASIAGGRKTLGYYLGYALSLFGRPRDRLSHVLVSEPYESSWDFFYPTPYSRVIQLPDGRLADTRDAEVTLAEIPFVRLRDGLDRHLLEKGARFSDLVQAANAAFAPPELVIDPAHRCLRAAGRVIRLSPAPLALYLVFAKRAKAGEPPLRAPNKHAPDREWAERFLREYEALLDPLEDGERTQHALREGMDGDYFSQLKSRLKREMVTQLGQHAAAPYLPVGEGNPPRFHLNLPPEAIRFEDLGRTPEGAEVCRGTARPAAPRPEERT